MARRASRGQAEGAEAADDDAPAQGAEEPLAEEEDEAEAEEHRGEEDGSDDEAGEGRRPADLGADGGRLGPGEGEVGGHEAASRPEEPTELLAQPDRLILGGGGLVARFGTGPAQGGVRPGRSRRRGNVQGRNLRCAGEARGTRR
ncbi:MAG: hypothetical protein KatS3mg065_1277 [Chloroflexota bacterium]|nr:MAG: hypothetical protein KatS3mg065_1277 [Chloroflexota bacterium]